MISLLPAFSDATRKLVYRIRHEVYCEELGFEPARADGHERDEFDRHSLHCLARTSHDMTPVGCVRLVLPHPDAPEQPLPFESICRIRPLRDKAELGRRRSHRIAEISRLAIRSQFRRSASERFKSLLKDKRPKGLHRLTDIPLALYLGALALAEAHGIDTLFALSEPHLPRFFARLGGHGTVMGEPVHHHGLRIPWALNVRHFLADMHPSVRSIWHAIREEMGAHLHVSPHHRQGLHGMACDGRVRYAR